jgi:hypothetical protein
MNKKIGIIALLIIAAGIFFYSDIGYMLSPGSYAFAEIYELNEKESVVIEAIQTFKKNHPEYAVPSPLTLTDGRINEQDYWYHIYFYYKEENLILNTWVRQVYYGSKAGTTEFAFVGINHGLTLGNWKYINDDIKRGEKKEQLALFETRILNPITSLLHAR